MKKTIYFLFIIPILLSGQKSFAQFNELWKKQYQHTIANNYSSESRKVVQDAAGNVYVLSDHTSNLDSLGNIAGGTHHYTSINKYSSTGNRLHRISIEVFNHVVSGNDNLGAFGIELDASANLYVGYTPYASASGFNVAIAKYDSALNKIWVSQYSTTNSDVGVDMKLAAAGMVYFIQKTTAGATTTYSVHRTNSGSAPVTVYTFASNEVLNSLALGSNADIYVTGYKTVSNTKSFLMAGIEHNFFLLKWIVYYDGGLAGNDYGNQITVGVDGNVYAVGTSTQNPVRGTDVVILKHPAAAGSKLSWASLQHYTTVDEGKFISVPEIDYAYVGGTSGNQIILYRINITGVPIAQFPTYYRPSPTNLHNSINGVTLNAMVVSSSKKVYITGAINSTDLSGQTFSALYLAKFSIVFGNVLSLTYDVPARGDYNNNFKGTGLSLDYAKTDIYWLCDNWNNNTNHQQEYAEVYDMDVSSPLRTAKDFSSAADVSIFPNPASEKITVKSDQIISSVEISDLTGKVIRMIEPNSVDAEINVTDFNTGIYLCKSTGADGSVSIKKFMVK